VGEQYVRVGEYSACVEADDVADTQRKNDGK
jgi:hypothetical protein